MWISIEDLTIKYKEKYIYDKTSIDVIERNVFLIGKNGMGKTSLLDVIYKYKNYEGEIYIDNKNLKNISKEKLRKDISYIKQFALFFEELSVKENLKILKVNKNKYNSYIKKFKVKDFINKKVKELSGGEKQVLNICVGLSKGKKILLIDEPLNNLSKENKKVLIDLLKEDKRNKIIISHEEIILKSKSIMIRHKGLYYE